MACFLKPKIVARIFLRVPRQCLLLNPKTDDVLRRHPIRAFQTCAKLLKGPILKVVINHIVIKVVINHIIFSELYLLS